MMNENDTPAGVTGPAPAATKAPKGMRLRLQQMLAGMQAVIPSGSTLVAPGTGLAQPDIVSQLQAYVAEFTAVDAQELALKQARKQLNADEAAMRAYLRTLKNALLAMFGNNSPALSQFGVSAKLRRPPTPKESVASAAKAAATRALRGTQGPKQRLAKQFQGTVVVEATPLPAAKVADGG